jgi:hypothetical protein
MEGVCKHFSNKIELFAEAGIVDKALFQFARAVN